MEALPHYISASVLSIKIHSEELPLRTFIVYNSKKVELDFVDQPDWIALSLKRERFTDFTDLNTSDVVLFLFLLLVICQFYELKYHVHLHEDFAAKADQLPRLYSAAWSECFTTLKKNYTPLR